MDKRSISIFLLGCLLAFVVTMAYHSIKNKQINQKIANIQSHLKETTVKLKTYEEQQKTLSEIDKLIPKKIPLGERIALQRSIYDAHKKFDIPISTICAIIQVESNWDQRAKSNVGALGYMQVMPATAAEMLKKYKLPTGKITDPYINIMAGTAYLRFLYDKFGKQYQGEALTIIVFVAYNRGHNNNYLKQNVSLLKQDNYVLKVEKALSRIALYL